MVRRERDVGTEKEGKGKRERLMMTVGIKK
jgi:hypothetical protein